MVVIDRQEHTLYHDAGKSPFLRYPKYGHTFMYMTDSPIKAVYAEAPEYARAKRFERLIALSDLSEEDCYFLDIFRTQGGKEHAKFVRNGFSTLETHGLNLQETDETYHEAHLMKLKVDKKSIQGCKPTFCAMTFIMCWSRIQS